MKSNLFLATRTTLRNKKTIILILLISTILLLGTIISTYQKSVTEHISKYSNSIYENLMYTVGKPNSKYKENEKVLSEIEHIRFISPEYDIGTFSLYNDEWQSKYTDGNIWINVANNNTIPKITKGNKFPKDDDYYLICPEILYANSSINSSKDIYHIRKKDGIDMSKYLDKYINFKEEVIIDEEIGEKEINAKIIGLYKVDKYLSTDNTCYSNANLRRKTYDMYYEDANLEVYEYVKNPNSALIIIDNYNNHDEVMNKLSELGYHVEAYAEYDPNTLKDLNNNSKIFSIIILIICIVLITIFLLRNTLSRKEEFKIYHYLGYTSSNIIILNIISNLIIMFASLILSLLLSLIYKYVLKIIIYNYPFFFNKMEVMLSIRSLLLIFIIAATWSVVCSVINSLLIRIKR